MAKSLNNKFAKNTFILTIGSILSQAITILASLIITRLYSVDVIGKWSVYISLISVLACFITLRYEYSIVIPENDIDAGNILVFCLGILLFLTFVISLLFFVFKDSFFIKKQGLDGLEYYVPFSLIGIGLFQIFNYWCVRKAEFFSITMRNVFNALLSAILEIGLGVFMIFGENGLIIGSTMGTFCAGVFIAILCLKNNKKYIFKNISLSIVKKNMYEQRRFPMFSTWSALLNQISATVVTFALSYFYNQTVVGFFSIAQQVLTLPMTFIGNSIGQVLYSNSTNYVKGEDLSDNIQRILIMLISIGTIPIILISICAPSLCEFIYGLGWETAGVYIRYLVPWLLIGFIVSPLTVLFDTLAKQKEFLIFNMVIFIGRLIVLFIGGTYFNVEATIAIYSVLGTIHYLIVGGYLLHLCNCNLKSILDVLVRIISKQVIRYLVIPILMLLINITSLYVMVICILMGCAFIVFEGKTIVLEMKEEKKGINA